MRRIVINIVNIEILVTIHNMQNFCWQVYYDTVNLTIPPIWRGSRQDIPLLHTRQDIPLLHTHQDIPLLHTRQGITLLHTRQDVPPLHTHQDILRLHTRQDGMFRGLTNHIYGVGHIFKAMDTVIELAPVQTSCHILDMHVVFILYELTFVSWDH